MADLDLSQFLEVFGGVVLCPACRFSDSDSGFLTHLSRVEVDQGGDVVEVDRDGPGFLRRPPSARGAVICIDFYCEERHEFRLNFRFHKGSTYCWVSGIRETPVGANGSYNQPRELWRN
jgi:hypothetical protein